MGERARQGDRLEVPNRKVKEHRWQCARREDGSLAPFHPEGNREKKNEDRNRAQRARNYVSNMHALSRNRKEEGGQLLKSERKRLDRAARKSAAVPRHTNLVRS